jgi:hypothetical protein
MTTGERPTPTREVTVRVRYRFLAPDGSHVDVVVPGESLDKSDKGVAKAMSVAYRIALIQLFCLPTDEPDPDASYHTRDGAGSMSKSVAELLRQRIGLGMSAERQMGTVGLADAIELERLWPIVLEHAAAERNVPDVDATITWAQAFMGRFSVLIEEIETIEQGRAVTTVIERMGLMRQLGVKLRERGAFVKERTARTFDHCMERIQVARSVIELNTAVGCAEAAEEERIIDKQQLMELVVIAEERRPKLPLDVEREPGSEAEAGAATHWTDNFLEPEGDSWDTFVTAADAENLSAGAIMRLIDGYEGSPPAVTWGKPGLQRVADAVARAHRRDHSIDNQERSTLQQYLMETAELAGLDPEPYRGWSE